jgi:hypothetical protein
VLIAITVPAIARSARHVHQAAGARCGRQPLALQKTVLIGPGFIAAAMDDWAGDGCQALVPREGRAIANVRSTPTASPYTRPEKQARKESGNRGVKTGLGSAKTGRAWISTFQLSEIKTRTR